MENDRFRPYVRERARYRSWLKDANPVPPPSTQRRILERQQRNQHNINIQNVNENIQVVSTEAWALRLYILCRSWPQLT